MKKCNDYEFSMTEENNKMIEHGDKLVDLLIDEDAYARILIEEIVSELISDLK